MRAEKLARRAARVGFDWPDAAQVLDKLDEEVAELKEAVGLERPDPAHVAEELGDVLFVIANLCRKLGVDAEGALRGANDKFTRRFSGMEALAEVSGRRFEDLTLAEQEALWTQVKVQERSSR
jgi:ATP diphosphatase